MKIPQLKAFLNIFKKLNRFGNLILLISFSILPAGWMSQDQNNLNNAWGSKPVLSYFVLTASWHDKLRADTALSSMEWAVVEYNARHEADQLSNLYRSSQRIIDNHQLSLRIKRILIWLSGYNWQVEKILRETDRALKSDLAPDVYFRLRNWFDSHWLEEVARRGLASQKAFARSYEIYATRYDSGGAYTVALPDKCLKFSNAGNHLCDDMGYAVGQNYTVFLSYKKGTAATVLESGPWNVDDNYWSGWGDPQPRRMFADLALGMPEAQAAFFNNYNGGVDQFGRKVTAPYGIDLARQVSIDIGLQPGVNDWITVSYMWTETWGSASSPVDPNSTSQASQGIQAIQTATADSTGAVIHEVKFGQTLWAIADAYQVNLQDIYILNNLSEDSVIIPGQQLVILQNQSTPLPDVNLTLSDQPSLTPTKLFSATPVFMNTAIPDSTPLAQVILTQTDIQVGSPLNNKANDQILWIILGLLGVGIGLLLLGGVLQQRG